MKIYWFRTAHLSEEQISSIMDRLEENGDAVGAFTRQRLGNISYIVRRPSAYGGYIWIAGLTDHPDQATGDSLLVEIQLEGL